MIEAEQLVHDYGEARALDGATMSAPEGAVTALVGPNGAGKTTLMRILAGLLRPQQGRARIGDVDVADDPQAVHAQVGFLADFIGLYDELSAERHLIHFGRAAGLSRAAARTRAETVAVQLSITPLLPRRAREMSRGQRQRLAIAQALMKSPRLLIWDEPASGLDPEARRGLSDLMAALKREGVTILVSSHILSELDDYCDHVAVMRSGRVARVESLAASASAAQTILIEFAEPISATALAAALGAERAPVVDPSDPLRARVSAPSEPGAQAALLSDLIAAGARISAFTPQKRRLADAYFAAADAEAEPGDRQTGQAMGARS